MRSDEATREVEGIEREMALTPIWFGPVQRRQDIRKTTNEIDLPMSSFAVKREERKKIQPSHSAVLWQHTRNGNKLYVILRLTSRGVNSFRFTAYK